MVLHANTTSLSLLAASLLATAPLAYSATAQVGVSAFAFDLPSGADFIKNTDGSLATGFASRAVTTIAGNSTSHAEATADALGGIIRAKVNGSVAASNFAVARDAGGTIGAFMEGSINLVGPPLPGLATFTAQLDGTYNVAGLQTGDNRANLHYEFIVGNSPQMAGELPYFCCVAGAFSIPFSWTQLVQAGDAISFYLLIKADAQSVASVSEIDSSSTFKIVSVELPPGFTFTSDAQGFLSQFGSPVPVPPAAWLMGWALGALAFARRRA